MQQREILLDHEPGSTPNDTRALLIDVAEEQFALHGIAGVSLREVGRIAGCANTGAVRYHFGDRDGLIAAIFRSRLAVLEHQRAALLARADAAGAAPDMRAYLDMLFRPVERQRGRSGRRSYAALLAGLAHFDELSVWGQYSGELPATGRIMAALRARILPGEPARFDRRFLLMTAMVWHGLTALDRAKPGADAEPAFQDLLDMAAAALAAAPG